MNKKPRIVVAEDVKMILHSLEALLTLMGNEVVATAGDGMALLQAVEATRPDVVITDIMMPHMNGIEACRRIRELYPLTEVIGLTLHDEDQFVVDMFKAGAKGFLFKDESMEELRESIEAVLEGRYYHCKKTPTRLMQLLIADNADPFRKDKQICFSEKERQVIRLICRDYTSKEIAGKLGLTENTVNKYRQKIMEKLNVLGVAGIVLYAIKMGLIGAEDISIRRRMD